MTCSREWYQLLCARKTREINETMNILYLVHKSVFPFAMHNKKMNKYQMRVTLNLTLHVVRGVAMKKVTN